jgi:alpha-tubulin suppressor-like RCC1 family protein
MSPYVTGILLVVCCCMPGTHASSVSVVQLSAGLSHTCALLSNGSMKCWGKTQYGQVGYGSTASVSTPGAVGFVDVVAM